MHKEAALLSGKSLCLSQRDAGEACWRQRGKTSLATIAKDAAASIPGEKQWEITVGVMFEEWVAILHLL